jgi:redox-sensitive bicupin YhaK (pirin superfamily)
LIRIYPADSRYHADHGWLTSYFSFSFAEYYDPANMSFGPLRVFNDDTIQPGTGFDMHPHANMEIVTYVIEGTLEHRDSMGNRGVLRAGEVQRMTAGTGVYHSEYNGSDKDTLHLLQMWFLPDQKNREPSWEQGASPHRGPERGHWVPVVSGRGHRDTRFIHQDLTIFLAALDEGQSLPYEKTKGRRSYLFVISGQILLNDAHTLGAGDAVRMEDEFRIAVAATAPAELMLIDLP